MENLSEIAFKAKLVDLDGKTIDSKKYDVSAAHNACTECYDCQCDGGCDCVCQSNCCDCQSSIN
jgi:hypothetical protein